MKSALEFLVAARRDEIHSLEQLARACELVHIIGVLIHALQRERGTASVFVASGGARFADQLDLRVRECEQLEAEVRACFSALTEDAGGRGAQARLFSRIAFVVNALDELPALRARIRAREPGPDDIIAAFTRLIGGLMAVIFEAADTASDPELAHALVALFNFMQGKELAGQERATTGAGLAAGQFSAERQQRLHHLIDAQQRCLEHFNDFATSAQRGAWCSAESGLDLGDLERARRQVFSGEQSGVPRADAAAQWFDMATQRIDAMQHVEDRLAVELLQLSERKIARARSELDDHALLLASLAEVPHVPSAVLGEHGDVEAPDDSPEALGSHLGRSILDLLHAQAQRLETMQDELDNARSALEERKLIERAKGVLMTHRRLSEDQAYRLLRRTAMDQGQRLVEVARTVLACSSLLESGAGEQQ